MNTVLSFVDVMTALRPANGEMPGSRFRCLAELSSVRKFNELKLGKIQSWGCGDFGRLQS